MFEGLSDELTKSTDPLYLSPPPTDSTESEPMVSLTQKTSRIRRRKQTTNGKANKRERRARGTPAFPIHVDVPPTTGT